MGVKRYVFAIFAVTAALAFIGAGAASATVLCNEAATECASYEKGAVVDASLTETTTFSTTGGTVLDECTFGMVEGRTSNAGGTSETVNEAIAELPWESCTNTTDTTNKGELEIHWISGTNNGTVTGKNVSVTLNTAFGSCTYGTGTALDLGTLTGGSPATIDVNTILAKQAGGFACPSEVKWSAHYKAASPEPLYVGSNSNAAAPGMEVTNTGGGMPIKETDRCLYSGNGQTCEIKVTNTSNVILTVTQEEIIQAEAKRFELTAGCGVNKEIAKGGGSCIAKVKIIKEPGRNWNDGYYIRVREKETPMRVAAATVFLRTP